MAARIADIRRDYTGTGLSEGGLARDPRVQFQRWLDEALAADAREPTAMTLATVDPSGAPDARIVLLKGVDPDGFVFYTDYRSAKGRQLASEPRAALVFFWAELERQVRITGRVGRVTPEETDAYFRSRPRGSRIGAWASEQSRVLPDRKTLDDRVLEVARGFPGEDIPTPPHWGGFRLVPDTVEFWQGRPDRLHDRLRYRKDGAEWVVERLAP